MMRKTTAVQAQKSSDMEVPLHEFHFYPDTGRYGMLSNLLCAAGVAAERLAGCGAVLGQGKGAAYRPFSKEAQIPGRAQPYAMAGQGGNTGERGMPRRKSRAERAKVRGTCLAGEKPHALMRKAERQAAEPA